MATTRILVCPRCGPSLAEAPLFDLLFSESRGRGHTCALCGAGAELHLKFEFGLNAGDAEMPVYASFSPRKPSTWKDRDGSKVTYYPFLVLVGGSEDRLSVWLPYWHVVQRAGKERKLYGQWAPFMDSELFETC